MCIRDRYNPKQNLITSKLPKNVKLYFSRFVLEHVTPEDIDNIQTKFDYHNRLRLPQYIDIFEEIGFKIAYLDYDKVSKNSKKYEDYKKLKIYSDYAKFKEEHLLAGSINLLLRKPVVAKK